MTALRELLSFGTIGIVSNASLYVVYLGMTGLGVGAKTALTAVFALGVLGTYAFNRRCTFRHAGTVAPTAARYTGVYLLAYLANVAALALLVDGAGLPHQAVMLGLMVATAVLVFALQKFWVFAAKPAAVWPR
jgi:putative flippase GtrA